MRDDNIIEVHFSNSANIYWVKKGDIRVGMRTQNQPHILGVHRKTTNIAVLSELSVYSLKLDTRLNILII